MNDIIAALLVSHSAHWEGTTEKTLAVQQLNKSNIGFWEAFTHIYFLSSTESNISTRLHFSSMHTARLLPVSPSMHCLGGCLAEGGVLASGPEMVGIPAGNGTDPLPPVNRITGTCKNITLPQLRCGR